MWGGGLGKWNKLEIRGFKSDEFKNDFSCSCPQSLSSALLEFSYFHDPLLKNIIYTVEPHHFRAQTKKYSSK